jgi:hypothetical protein
MIIKKAVLKSFNSQNYTAVVQITGSGTAYLSGISTSRNIPAAEMLPGRHVAVLFWDKSNPSDSVLFSVW